MSATLAGPGFRVQVLVVLLLLVLLPRAQGAEAMAPEFVLPDADGRMVSLADFRGKPLVLTFWASWCPYCKRLHPGLEQLAARYSADGLVVLGVSMREDEAIQPQEVLAARGVTFRTLLEGDEVADLYQVKGTPTTFFINATGEIIGMTHASSPDDPELARLAALIVGS